MAVFAVTVSQTDKLLRDPHAATVAKGTRRLGVVWQGLKRLDTCGSIAQQAVRCHSTPGGSPLRAQTGFNTGLALQLPAADIRAVRTMLMLVRSPFLAGDGPQSGLSNQHRIKTVRCACAVGAAIYPYDSPLQTAHRVFSGISQSDSLPSLLLKLHRRVSCGRKGQGAYLVNGKKYILVPRNYKRHAVFKFGLLFTLTLKFIFEVNKQLQAVLVTCYAAKFFAVEPPAIDDLSAVLKNLVKRCAQAAINMVAFVQVCDSDRGAQASARQAAAAHFDMTARSGLLLLCEGKHVLHQTSFNLKARVPGVLA